MISVGTNLKVIDNTGIKEVRCLKILGVGTRKYGKPGDLVVVSKRKGKVLKTTSDNQKVYKGVIVRVKYPVSRLGGEIISFEDNAVVLLKKDSTPIGSRVLGPVMMELREKKYMKIVSLALICL